MEIISKSVKNTLTIGAKIAGNLKKKDIICLFGGFGAGKTILTKGIAAGKGIVPGSITSPSFVLLRQYHSRAQAAFYHFDLYRLKSPADILALGYEDYFYGDGITVIEWADRLSCLLPEEYLKIELSIKSKSERIIKLSGIGRHYQGLAKKIYEDIRH